MTDLYACIRQEYYRGDAMRAATANGGRSAFGGYFPVPTPGPGGQCVETSYGRFMEPVRSNSCARVVEDLETSCETALSPQRFVDVRSFAIDSYLAVSYLKCAALPARPFSFFHVKMWLCLCSSPYSRSVCANHKSLFSSCESWVNVEIGTVSYRNPHTLEEFTESLESAPITSLHVEASNTICENSVVEACYYLYYSPEGAITQVCVTWPLMEDSSIASGPINRFTLFYPGDP